MSKGDKQKATRRKTAGRLPQLLQHRIKRNGRVIVYAYALFNGQRESYGRWGPEAERQFAADLALWTAHGGKFPEDTGGLEGLTVRELAARYLAQLEERKGADWLKTTGNGHVYGLRTLLEVYGESLASEFGPLKLKATQRAMIAQNKVPALSTINRHTTTIKALFRWGAGEELVPSSVWEGVSAVDSLKEGDFEVRNTKRTDVDMDVVEATLPYIPPPLDAVIRLLWETGARPAEILGLRPQDIDQSRKDGVWVAVLGEHKTAGKGKGRFLVFTAAAQSILAPFMLRPAGAPLFSPAEAVDAMHRRKREGRKTELWASHEERYERERAARPDRVLRDCYDHHSLRRAVERAISAANRHRKADGLDPLPKWTPYQVRHSAGTDVARKCGSDDSRVVLGHAIPGVTGRYVHEDIERTVEAHKRRSAAS